MVIVRSNTIEWIADHYDRRVTASLAGSHNNAGVEVSKVRMRRRMAMYVVVLRLS